MATMPIRPLVPPAAVKSQPNGSVDDSLLGVVDSPSKLYKLAKPADRAMRALHAAVKEKFNVQLTTTGRGRTLAIQWNSFGGAEARYKAVSASEWASTPADRRKKWPLNDYTFNVDGSQLPAPGRASVARILGVTIPNSDYWVKIRQPNGAYPATSAVPGTSNHGFWCADDIALPDGPDDNTYPDGIGIRADILNWLYENEVSFGFAHSLQSEPWHIQWIGGDNVTQRVLDYEAGQQHTPTEPEQPPTTPQEDDMAIGVIELTDAGAQFIGECTAAGGFLSVIWIDSQKLIGVRDTHLANGAKKWTYTKSVMKNIFVNKLPVGDRVPWSESDVAGVL